MISGGSQLHTWLVVSGSAVLSPQPYLFPRWRAPPSCHGPPSVFQGHPVRYALGGTFPIDRNSILNFYKQLIAIRRDQPALRNGSYEALNRRDADVLSYLRKNPQSGESVLVVLNMSNQPKTTVQGGPIARQRFR